MNIPLITLLIFCAEGDNIPGVLLVTNQLNRWLNVTPVTADETPRWKYPISWKLFFGHPPPMTMYWAMNKSPILIHRGKKLFTFVENQKIV